ncbi:MAG: hypothetical protein Fur0010_15360 [Bdellovibrio sp.]
MITSDINREEIWLRELVLKTGQEKFRPYLEAISIVLDPLKIQFKKRNVKIITIGGTNGKGETSMRLYHHLLSSGKNVALWTSPHILSVTERMSYNGTNINFNTLEKIAELKASDFKDLSFYEFLFACFCFWVSDLDVEYLVLEVGLGGRFDAVNVFDANYCALTSIDLDHQEFLGDTREKILAEKYPISRSNSPLLTSIKRPELRKLLQDWTNRDLVPWCDLFELQFIDQNMNFSQRNAVLAASLFMLVTKGNFGLGSELNRLSQTKMNLLARQELMTYVTNSFIFIGAHNREGFEELLYLIDQKNEFFDQVWCSFSKRSIGEMKVLLDGLLQRPEKIGKVCICEFDHTKASGLEELIKLVDEYKKNSRLHIFTIEQWKNSILQSSGHSLVTGSYYFIADVQRFFYSTRNNQQQSVCT